jgi:hypothetical protein
MDGARAVAVDADGATYVAGVTSSSDFPVVAALQGTKAAGKDAFVAKIAADGTVVFATYLGGSGEDEATSIAVDPSGRVLVGGRTTSSNFPVANALQSVFGGGTDGFVACLAADGSALEYATYVGAGGADGVVALAADGDGNAWLGCETDAVDFETTPGVPSPEAAVMLRGWIARLSADGSERTYASYLDSYVDDLVRAIHVDASGAVYVAGTATTIDAPEDVFPVYDGGSPDAFVAKFDATTLELSFVRYFGGHGVDAAAGIAVEAGGSIQVAGTTNSNDFPAPVGTVGTSGGNDAFLVRLSADGSYILRTQLLGGAGADSAAAVVLDAQGDPVVAGTTASADFPATEPGAAPSGTAVFAARFSGSALAYAVVMDGPADDVAAALALEGEGMAVVAGSTKSGAADPFGTLVAGNGGGEDALLARIPTVLAAPSNLGLGTVGYYAVTITWEDPSDGVSSFEVQRRLGAASWQSMALLPPGTTSWTDESVFPDNSYTYRVRALYDAMVSTFTNETIAVTPHVPVPQAPGSPTAEAVTARRIRVQWLDLSETETFFYVYRSVDGGAFELVRVAQAGTTQWYDDGATPDRAYAYRVGAVGVSGSSSQVETDAVTTASTLTVEVLKGKRTDKLKVSRDSVTLKARYQVDGGEPLDVRAEGIRIGVGPEDGAAILSVLPGDAGWKERRGVLTWKSPRGADVKAKLVVDTVRGTITLTASRLDLPQASGGAVRVWIRIGDDGGSDRESWISKKGGSILQH